MILTLKNGLVKLKENSLENINDALIYLDFQDFELGHNHIVKVFFNNIEQYKVSINKFKINPRSFTNNNMEIKIHVLSATGFSKEYIGIFNLEQYFSFGKQGYEKIPQVLIDLNKEIQKLENRIIELEKEKNVI